MTSKRKHTAILENDIPTSKKTNKKDIQEPASKDINRGDPSHDSTSDQLLETEPDSEEQEKIMTYCIHCHEEFGDFEAGDCISHHRKLRTCSQKNLQHYLTNTLVADFDIQVHQSSVGFNEFTEEEKYALYTLDADILSMTEDEIKFFI